MAGLPHSGGGDPRRQADALHRPDGVDRGLTMSSFLRRGYQMFIQARDRAQGLVEYGLIIALVAVLAIAGLIIFGPAVSSLLSKLGGSV